MCLRDVCVHDENPSLGHLWMRRVSQVKIPSLLHIDSYSDMTCVRVCGGSACGKGRERELLCDELCDEVREPRCLAAIEYLLLAAVL